MPMDLALEMFIETGDLPEDKYPPLEELSEIIAQVLNVEDEIQSFTPLETILSGAEKQKYKSLRINTRSLRVRMKKRKRNEEKFYFLVCGKEISTEEYESYDGLCWECWDDQMTEECEFEEDII